MLLLYGLANRGEVIEPFHSHPGAGDRSTGTHCPCLCTKLLVAYLRQVLGSFVVLLSLPALRSERPQAHEAHNDAYNSSFTHISSRLGVHRGEAWLPPTQAGSRVSWAVLP